MASLSFISHFLLFFPVYTKGFAMSDSKTVFVTVGSTSFDSLIETILDPNTLELIRSRGFTKVVLQTGRGKDFQSRCV